MKAVRPKRVVFNGKRRNQGIFDPLDQTLSLNKVKVFDLNWLRNNWGLQGWGGEASISVFSPALNPNVLPQIEAFLSATRILEELEKAICHEEYLKVSGMKKLIREKGIFNSELINFLAATNSSEENLGHSRFVAAYTVFLAQHSGINDWQALIDIERGALLHDIGKIGIPEKILQKKEPLTEEEMEIIKYHPLIGFAMIEEFSFLQGAAEIVLFHHEKYDGTGYPFGLHGEEIPLSARIFSLSDTLDAITSDRPYRQGRSFEEALAEIEKGKGTQFDPRLVEIMLTIPAGKWQKLKEKIMKTLHRPAVH